jgi:hypothetical protein
MSKYFNSTYLILYISISVIVNLLSKTELFNINLYMITFVFLLCLFLGQINKMKKLIERIHINILKSTAGQLLLCRSVILEATVYDISFYYSIGLGIFLFGLVYQVLLGEDFILLIISHLFILLLINYGRYRYHFLNTTNLNINKDENINFEIVFKSISKKLYSNIQPKFSYRYFGNLHGASQLLREFLKNPFLIKGAALGATLSGAGLMANAERDRILADRALNKKLAYDREKLALDKHIFDNQLALDREKLVHEAKMMDKQLDLAQAKYENLFNPTINGVETIAKPIISKGFSWWGCQKEEEYSFIESLIKVISSFL